MTNINFGRQMEGFGCQKQVLVFFWFLAYHATIAASPLNLLQSKENSSFPGALLNGKEF